jgi:hypothetical protein
MNGIQRFSAKLLRNGFSQTELPGGYRTLSPVSNNCGWQTLKFWFSLPPWLTQSQSSTSMAEL